MHSEMLVKFYETTGGSNPENNFYLNHVIIHFNIYMVEGIGMEAK